jgi:prefoldin subunit 5
MANINELKAAAYDLIANIDYLQKKLSEINQAIAKTVKEEKEKEDGSSDSSTTVPVFSTTFTTTEFGLE